MARTKKPVVPLKPMPIRFVRLHAKLVIGALVGVAIIAFAPFAFLTTRLLVGWDIGIALYLLLVHWTMARCGIDRIRARAAEQDEGAFAILLLTMLATFASLFAIVFALGGSKQAPHEDATLLIVLTIGTILLSWFFVHTIFALHYAHEYYGERSDGAIGGLNFPDEKAPDYWDFFYFSVVIGMTSQVSDVAISSRSIRRIATMHGILAFFFNVAVLALTINTVSNAISN
ncbi:MAG: DUF1345 domain-containing protein [Pseudolabrys sp.]